jgi:acetoacetate decarboxylase
MRYEPVKVMRLFARVFNQTGEFIRETRDYFQVRTTTETFGHKHKTEAAALPCKERMQRAWTKKHSDQAKAAFARRKAANA